MFLDRQKVFQHFKSSRLFISFTQQQVDGINAKLDEWEKRKFTDLRWLAYIFATSYHETGKAMYPVEEGGKGRTRPYGKKIKHSGLPYIFPDKIFYGRGDVQLTWYENYELMGRLLGIDLLNNPELALQPDVSARILFEGMTKGASSFGDFTGKCLEMYFNANVSDPVGARRIVNGSDKAQLIASYYYDFFPALKLAA